MRVYGMNYYQQIPLGQPSQMQPLCEKTAATPPFSPTNNRKQLQTIANHCKPSQTTANFRPSFFHLFPFFRPSPSETPDKPPSTTVNNRQPPSTPHQKTPPASRQTGFSKLTSPHHGYLISCAQKMCQSSRLFRSTAPGFTLPSSGMPSASRIVLRTSSPWM